MREKKCCVNCGIANVPLYLGLDGNLHCADHDPGTTKAGTPKGGTGTWNRPEMT